MKNTKILNKISNIDNSINKLTNLDFSKNFLNLIDKDYQTSNIIDYLIDNYKHKLSKNELENIEIFDVFNETLENNKISKDKLIMKLIDKFIFNNDNIKNESITNLYNENPGFLEFKLETQHEILVAILIKELKEKLENPNKTFKDIHILDIQGGTYVISESDNFFNDDENNEVGAIGIQYFNNDKDLENWDSNEELDLPTISFEENEKSNKYNIYGKLSMILEKIEY